MDADRTAGTTGTRIDRTGTARSAVGVASAVGDRSALGTVSTVARALTAAAVLLSAVVHLDLWALGMRSVAVIGPAFLLNAIGGLGIALAILLWRHWLPLLGAIGFGAATLGAFMLSVTVGLFGVHESPDGIPQLLSAVSEIAAIVLAVVALVAERRSSRAER